MIKLPNSHSKKSKRPWWLSLSLSYCLSVVNPPFYTLLTDTPADTQETTIHLCHLLPIRLCQWYASWKAGGRRRGKFFFLYFVFHQCWRLHPCSVSTLLDQASSLFLQDNSRGLGQLHKLLLSPAQF